MRRMEWLGVFAIVGGFGLAACQPGGEEPAAQQQQPAAGAPTQAPATGQPAPTGQVPAGATPEMVAQGQQIFTGQGLCFSCHGMDAKGTQLAPNLTDDQWLWLDPAKGDMLEQAVNLIKTGVPQPKEAPAPMPPMGGASLTDEQVRAVASYVLSLNPQS